MQGKDIAVSVILYLVGIVFICSGNLLDADIEAVLQSEFAAAHDGLDTGTVKFTFRSVGVRDEAKRGTYALDLIKMLDGQSSAHCCNGLLNADHLQAHHVWASLYDNKVAAVAGSFGSDIDTEKSFIFAEDERVAEVHILAPLHNIGIVTDISGGESSHRFGSAPDRQSNALSEHSVQRAVLLVPADKPDFNHSFDAAPFALDEIKEKGRAARSITYTGQTAIVFLPTGEGILPSRFRFRIVGIKLLHKELLGNVEANALTLALFLGGKFLVGALVLLIFDRNIEGFCQGFNGRAILQPFMFHNELNGAATFAATEAFGNVQAPAHAERRCPFRVKRAQTEEVAAASSEGDVIMFDNINDAQVVNGVDCTLCYSGHSSLLLYGVSNIWITAAARALRAIRVFPEMV